MVEGKQQAMYPWSDSLNSWAEGTRLKIDALGLVTMLGAAEMDESIGRLVASPWLQFLPLLGAFVVAGDQFTERRPGGTLYSISAGMTTTETAGWFSRWVKTQGFETVRTRIRWEVGQRPPRWNTLLIGFLVFGLPLNGMLIALTVLSGDWWGFANALSMTASIPVKLLLVHLNCRAIDANIEQAERALPRLIAEFERELAVFQTETEAYEAEMARRRDQAGPQSTPPPLPPVRPVNPNGPAKLLLVTVDSRAISMRVEEYLVRNIFPADPGIRHQRLYSAASYLGWAAFAVHVLSLGMAAMPAQIFTILLLIIPTILTRFQVGCEDFRIGKTEVPRSCWITSRLKATVSKFPPEDGQWVCEGDVEESSVTVLGEEGDGDHQQSQHKQEARKTDVEFNAGNVVPAAQPLPKPKVSRRRQDLYVWLEPTKEEEESMKAWDLMPRNPHWLKKYEIKKEEHFRRRARQQANSVIQTW